jgi:formylglycine-generating enzyme required for sulfatase activity
MTVPSDSSYPIAQLKALLCDRAKLDLSPIELAEILWLASQRSEGRIPKQETASSSSESTPIAVVQIDAPPVTVSSESPPAPPTAAIVTEPPNAQEQDEPTGTALPINIPAAVALRNRRDIARSLRPLMRKVPSKFRQAIDEEATVLQIAEDNTWSPVVKPEPERWLELAIVIEVTSLLDVWHDSISEFQHLMARHGAFRDVRVWQLQPNENGKPQLWLQTAAGLKGKPRSPRELMDAGGRRLILLLSDCTSQAWRSGEIPKLLQQWSRQNPVTIAQLLPEHYWDRSALGLGYPVALRSRQPGALSRDWKVEGLSQRRRQRLRQGLKFPVVTIQPQSLGLWAKATAAVGEQPTTGIVLGGQALTTPPMTTTEPLTAKQLVRRFRGTASAQAQALADMMAVLPVNWSVIRLIQKNMGQGADSAQETGALPLAEIFLSGLLVPMATAAPTKPPGAAYDFVQGVRDVLLGTIPISEAKAVGDEIATQIFRQLPQEVQARVDADIARRFGDALSYFEAFLIPDLPWGDAVATEIFPFARVTRQVLQRWGGGYAELAEELARSPVTNLYQTSKRHVDEATAYTLLEKDLEYFYREIIQDFEEAFQDKHYRCELNLHPRDLVGEPAHEDIAMADGDVTVTLIERRLTETSADHVSFTLRIHIGFSVEISYFDLDEYHPEFNESPTFERVFSGQTANAVAEVVLLFSQEDSSEVDLELVNLTVEQPIRIDPRSELEVFHTVPSWQEFEFEVTTIAFDDDVPSHESDEIHGAAIANWFMDQHIEVQSYASFGSAMARKCDRMSLDLGDHYDVLAPWLVHTQQAISNKTRIFRYHLADASETTISRCVGFGRNLHNEGLLDEFDYDRATHTLSGMLSNQPEVLAFFNGGWFELYVCQKIVRLLQEQGLSYSYLAQPVMGLPDGNRLELDLFFLVEDKPLVIECKAGRVRVEEAIRQVARYGESLGILSSQRFVVALELMPEQRDRVANLGDAIVTDRENFLAAIQTVLETPLSNDAQRSFSLTSFEFVTATLTRPLPSADLGNALETLDAAVRRRQGQHLSDLERRILRSALESQTYGQIAQATGRNPQSVNWIASQLWDKLSPIFEQKVTKNRFIELLTSWLWQQAISRADRQGTQFVEDLGNGATLEMVAIPSGEFLMGSPENEPERFAFEGPQHLVTVSEFYLGKYPITQAQWRGVAGFPEIERSLNPEPSYFKGDERPVEQVSWEEAVEFCARLSQFTGREYRLPSEAEWEYACRAGTTTPFHYGETITPDIANYNGNYTYGRGPKGVYREETMPVGSFPANAFGLYDMHGNVWEWCLDHSHDNYAGAPADGSAWLSEEKGSGRLLRGGSWYINPGFCRSAVRLNVAPGLRINHFGFRVVCVAARTM